jgi:GMP reductase
MRIDNDVKLDFSDVLIRPKRSVLQSRKEVDVTRKFEFVNSGQVWEGVPIVAANMDHTGTFEMARALEKHGLSVAIHKHYQVAELARFFKETREHWYSMGILSEDLEKFNKVNQLVTTDRNTILRVVIDVANGYSESFVDFIKRFREKNPHVAIMAGNVVTAEMTEQLILSGVDVVKVGIGPGGTCLTRKVTGVGLPQLSAIIESADAAHGLGGLICGDGGCQVPGDVVKALAAGSDFVMLGSMLSGHDESSGDIICKRYLTTELDMNDKPIVEERKFKRFYGMSSKEAQEKHGSSLKDYRASEGKSVLAPYKGPVKDTIQEILGGLRSGCTYTGAKKLKELPKRATFVRVNRQLNDKFGN